MPNQSNQSKSSQSNRNSRTNKKIIEQTVKNLSGQIIKNIGLELWNVEFYNDAGEYILEITIDKPGGFISLDDCEKVTHAINPVLDEADPIEQSHSLVVSSPGIDRELKNDYHVSQYIGKPVTVSLFAKREGLNKSFPAILKNYENNLYQFKTENAENTKNEEVTLVTLEKKEIARLCARDEI